MHFKTILMAAAAATLTVLGACDQPTGLANADNVAQQKFAPTSKIDAATGEAVALNYRPGRTVVTVPENGPALNGMAVAVECDPSYQICEPCDPTYQYCEPEPCDPTYQYCEPCDPIYDYGCEPCPRDNPSAWCYTPPCNALITTYSHYGAGIQPYGALEVSGTTSSSCGFLVLTGIGARINGSDTYTTLALRGRRLNPDGSWGETVDYRFGSSPYHSLEAWGEVPYSPSDFYGITGIGIGQNGTEDVRTLVIYYRKIEVVLGRARATGPTYTMRFGANPYGYTDASYVTYYDNQVFVGAGFRAIDEGERTATMAAYVGYLP
jgi:hypothetical protein